MFEKFSVVQLAYDATVWFAAIAAEVTRRRIEARRLCASVRAEWIGAKARFEQELLGNFKQSD